MNFKGTKFLFAAAFAAFMLLGSCSGKKNGAVSDAAPAFTTDSVTWADSMSLSGCNADVKITGRYPSGGNQQLLDSVRAWLGNCLGRNIWNTDSMLFIPTARQLESGNAIAEACGKALLASAKKDFQGFARDSITTDYEYIYNFGPDFTTDKVITYFCTRYGYAGGAHGGTMFDSRSFVAATGQGLTYANMFRADSRPQLVKMLRSALWEQYFKPSAEDPSYTLRDMLLIDPDTLPLPQCPPVFSAKGIVFTYQQYEIAPYAAGMPACVLPYTEMKPLLTSEVAGLIPE